MPNAANSHGYLGSHSNGDTSGTWKTSEGFPSCGENDDFLNKNNFKSMPI